MLTITALFTKMCTRFHERQIIFFIKESNFFFIFLLSVQLKAYYICFIEILKEQTTRQHLLDFTVFSHKWVAVPSYRASSTRRFKLGTFYQP